MFSESNAVCLVQYTIPLPQNTTVLSSLILTCVMHHQMEAKAVMSRLLQQFRISLPEGYELHVDTTAGFHPKGDVPCTLISIKSD